MVANSKAVADFGHHTHPVIFPAPYDYFIYVFSIVSEFSFICIVIFVSTVWKMNYWTIIWKELQLFKATWQQVVELTSKFKYSTSPPGSTPSIGENIRPSFLLITHGVNVVDCWDSLRWDDGRFLFGDKKHYTPWKFCLSIFKNKIIINLIIINRDSSISVFIIVCPHNKYTFIEAFARLETRLFRYVINVLSDGILQNSLFWVQFQHYCCQQWPLCYYVYGRP